MPNRLTGDGIRASLLKALENPATKTKALVLNALSLLYPDDPENSALTRAVFGVCDTNLVKIAKALSYDPDPILLTRCLTTLLTEKHWSDAASLVVRFDLPRSAFLPWLSTALESQTPDEFLAAADIVIAMSLNDPAIITSLRKRLSDSTESVKTAAAFALWSNSVDEAVVQNRIRQVIANNMAPSINYVALLHSKVRDVEVIRSLEKQLAGVGAGDFTDGWLVPRPDAFDVIESLKSDGALDLCLTRERASRPEDYAQATLTARAVIIGCRDRPVLSALDSFIHEGVPGLLGVMVDPKISEAYGRMLVDDNHKSFEEELDSLWELLRSRRSESSGNYRLALEYALADMVVGASSDSESRIRHVAVTEKVQAWAKDEAPHHRAAFVNIEQLINEALWRKRLLLLRTQF